MIHRRNQNAEKLAVILTLCNVFGDPKTKSFGGPSMLDTHMGNGGVRPPPCSNLGTVGDLGDLMKQLDRFRRRLTSASMLGQSTILTTNNRGCTFSACLLRAA